MILGSVGAFLVLESRSHARARGALRVALAQAWVLETPPHAAIATVLPLVDGGPRKLVHGVFGTLMRRNATLPEVPELPAAAWLRTGRSRVVAAVTPDASPPMIPATLSGPWSSAITRSPARRS